MEAEVRSTMAEKGRSTSSYAYQRITGEASLPGAATGTDTESR